MGRRTFIAFVIGFPAFVVVALVMIVVVMIVNEHGVTVMTIHIE